MVTELFRVSLVIFAFSLRKAELFPPMVARVFAYRVKAAHQLANRCCADLALRSTR